MAHDFYQSPAASNGEKRAGKHPTQKPVQLMGHFISLLSCEGDMVMDPFMGFEMAGFDVALANEYDPVIADAYIKNRHNANMVVADITKLSIEDVFTKFIGKFAVIIGGPPCQGFSQKGQRKTVNDERNFLFRYFYDVVKLVKPQYFLMENVPSLLTSERGYFRNEIDEMFGKLGYVGSYEQRRNLGYNHNKI